VVAVFGSTAGVILSSWVGGFVPALQPLLSPTAVVLLLAQPVFINWLVHLIRPQSRTLRLLVVAGFVISAVGYLARELIAPAVPLAAISLFVGVYFILAEGVAALTLYRLGRARHGLARLRLQVAAVATLLFALTILLLVVGSASVPQGAPNPAQPWGNLMALAAAFAYIVAFLPPIWLHGVAQRAIAFDLGSQLVGAPTGTEARVLWATLAEATRKLLGARRVELYGRAGKLLAETGETPADAATDRPVTKLDIPLGDDIGRVPHLLAEVDGRVLFVEDDIEVLRLLGAMTLRAVEREVALVRLAEADRELEAAAAGRASDARFRALLEAVPSAVMAVDHEGTVVWSTGPTASLLGVPVPELTGRRMADLLVEPDIELGSGPNDDRVRRAERTARRADGSQLLVDVAATIFELDERQYRLYVLSDASWRQAANQLRDRFLAVLSHELRTPITSIYGGTQLLLSRGERLADSTRHEVLINVAAEAERLLRITENLVVLARVECGADFFEFRPISLRPLLTDFVARESTLWPELTLDLEVEPGLPLVAGDEDYLGQVLRNLISNAGKYAGSGARVRIIAAPSEDQVSVRVIDNGRGLGTSKPEQLFELYHRAADTANRPGSGIGLFVCRSLVEAMGGRVWAGHAEGGGAEFGFSLPQFVEGLEDPPDVGEPQPQALAG
jgi:PAS domain S-box-containing protein